MCVVDKSTPHTINAAPQFKENKLRKDGRYDAIDRLFICVNGLRIIDIICKIRYNTVVEPTVNDRLCICMDG